MTETPTAEELFCTEAFERLRQSNELASMVRRLRRWEIAVRELSEPRGPNILRDICLDLVDSTLCGTDLELPAGDLEHPRDILRAVLSLPRRPATAGARRNAREVARLNVYLSERRLRVPTTIDDVRGLWELSMYGEPRLSEDFPNSELRKRDVALYGPLPECRVMHRCMAPEEVAPWLKRMLAMLADDTFALEVRAMCGLLMNDWIHPFADGNGHVGRLLELTMLNDGYNATTLLCLCRELLIHRDEVFRQFALLRNRQTDVTGFCLALLAQLEAAQDRALELLVQQDTCGARTMHDSDGTT